MISVNLIPRTVQLAQQRRYRVQCWAIALSATAAAVAVSGGVEWYRRVEAGKLHTLQRQIQRELDVVRTDVRTLTAEAEQVRLHAERAAALKSKRAWSGLFATVGSCMPESCWLISMATDPAVPGAAGPTSQSVKRQAGKPVAHSDPNAPAVEPLQIDAPRKLRLIGYAPDAADPHVFVTNLKNRNLFDLITLERSQREAALDGSYFRFELVCEW